MQRPGQNLATPISWPVRVRQTATVGKELGVSHAQQQRVHQHAVQKRSRPCSEPGEAHRVAAPEGRDVRVHRLCVKISSVQTLVGDAVYRGALLS